MEYSDSQLATHLHVNRSTAFRWRKVGCPTNDLQAAEQWAANRKPAAKKAMIEVVVPTGYTEPTTSTAESETAYDVRDRLQSQEKTISLEITGLNQALEEARGANDEKAAYKLLQALKSAREEHRRQADSLLKAEGRIILLEKNRGELVNLDVAKDFLSKILNPLGIYLRKLPDAGRNDEEKALLVTMGEAGLAVLRDCAREAIAFSGK
jgi:hypothetical protein